MANQPRQLNDFKTFKGFKTKASQLRNNAVTLSSAYDRIYINIFIDMTVRNRELANHIVQKILQYVLLIN